MSIERAALQAALKTASTRLQADREGTLHMAGLPSGLAYLALAPLRLLQQYDDQDAVVDLLRDLVGVEHRKVLRRALSGDLTAALCRLDEDAPLRAACQVLIEELSGPGQQPEPRTVMQVQGERVENVRQYNAGGDLTVHEASLDREAQKAERALTDYLRALRHASRTLQLSQIDQADSRFAQPMRLEQVYIRLKIERQVEQTEAKVAAIAQNLGIQLTRSLTALEALSMPVTRLLLLGAPGSGKSTFVNHLALCLAAAALCQRHADEVHPPEGWLACLPDWPHGALLPVRIVLRELAAFAPLAQAPQGSVELLREFLCSALGAHAAAVEPLAHALTDGRAILLFDGLDEVVGDQVLTRVVECIDAAAGTYTRCPVLVTCRVLDYQANPRRHLRGFTVETLAALDEEQVNAFIDAWYAELSATGRQVLGDALALRQAVSTRSELSALAQLPLLLTMMAIVHAGRGTLPDARALLYAECVELLLLRWRQEPGQKEILEQLELPQFRSTDLLALMALLGYEAHQQAERIPDDDRPAALTLAQVRVLLEEGFAPYALADELRRDRLVSLVLRAIATRNGLLLKQSGEQGEVYTFPHRTFQEFLAGYHLKGQQRDYLQRALGHAAQLHWHEVLTLMVGYQVLAERELERPLMLVQRLLDRGPQQQVLAGELLALIGRERASSYDPTVIQAGGLWHSIRDLLLRLSTEHHAPEVSTPLRVRAGLALGTLCYSNIIMLCQGVPAPLPDPRLLDPRIGESSNGSYWCLVKAISFWSSKGKRLRQIKQPYNFKIARLLVTNAEYARFVAEDGYNPEKPWWSNEGRKWLMPGRSGLRSDNDRPITQPWMWSNPRYSYPSQPVVGVSWYEAVAYAVWLTDQGHIHQWLSSDMVIRLPTLCEWQCAACNLDQRRYPWGDTPPTPEYANYDATGIGMPSPVGCFPAGQALCGALDMAGNVWEWTATTWEQPQQPNPVSDVAGQEMISAGGSFLVDGERLYCDTFSKINPFDCFGAVGFRLVCSPRSLM